MEILSGPNECVVLADNPTHQNLISNTSEVDPRECVLDTYLTLNRPASHIVLYSSIYPPGKHTVALSQEPHIVWPKGADALKLHFNVTINQVQLLWG